MGNESSSGILTEVSIDESPILTSPLWSLHHAQRIGRDGDGGKLVADHGAGGGRSKAGSPGDGRDEDGEQLSVFVAKSGGKRARKSSDVEPIGKVSYEYFPEQFEMSVFVANVSIHFRI